MTENFVELLKQIIPPPSTPSDCNETRLKWNKTILMTELPDDFLAFGRIYGSGTIQSAYSWYVVSAFRLTYPAFVLRCSRTHSIYRESQEIEDVPFGIFPEPDGILPFATTPDGDWVCWITEGEPNDWPVVDLSSYDDGQYEVLDMGFSEYFYRVLTRDVVLARHKRGNSWSTKDIRFEPTLPFDVQIQRSLLP